MNLKNEIAKLTADNLNSQEFKFNDELYEIFRCPVYSDNQIVKYRYYVASKVMPLGAGTYGSVYPASLVTEDYQLHPQKMAVKIFDDKQAYSEDEAKIMGRYCFTEQPIEERKRIILIMEYLGEELTSDTDELHPLIKSLSFLQRIDLITAILLNLNLLHHNTGATGQAIVHCDLKGPNILINKKHDHIDVSICDFGFSFQVSDDPQLLFRIEKTKSTPGHIPPELVYYARGLKSDVYSLLPVLLMILGAKDPFSKKQEIEIEVDNLQNNRDNSYDFEGIFTGYVIPSYINHLKPLIIQFLNRLHQPNYHQRPDSDELLHFFITLRNYCRNCDTANDRTLKYIQETKLRLLAEHSWYHNLGDLNIDSYTTKEVTPNPEQVVITKTFKHYDFDQHPQLSEIFVLLSRKDLFDHQDLVHLFKRDSLILAQTLLTLVENNNLNSKGLHHIVHNYSDNQIQSYKLLIDNNLLSVISFKTLTEELAITIQKLASYSVLNATNLKMIMNLSTIGKQYGLNFSLNDLPQIISGKGISTTEALKVVLRNYQDQRRGDKRGEYFHFWSRWTGFDEKTKCKAIDEFIDVLDHKNTTLSDLSKKALDNGRLKHIIAEFKKHDVIAKELDAATTPRPLFSFA